MGTLYGEKITQWNNDNVVVMTDPQGKVYYMNKIDYINDLMSDSNWEQGTIPTTGEGDYESLKTNGSSRIRFKQTIKVNGKAIVGLSNPLYMLYVHEFGSDGNRIGYSSGWQTGAYTVKNNAVSIGIIIAKVAGGQLYPYEGFLAGLNISYYL